MQDIGRKYFRETMMIAETQTLHQLIATRIHRIDAELQKELLTDESIGKLRAGTWSNDAGIVTGYLTYYPDGDVSKEAIEAIMSLTPAHTGLLFTAEFVIRMGSLLPSWLPPLSLKIPSIRLWPTWVRCAALQMRK